jgi:hypothetical protein
MNTLAPAYVDYPGRREVLRAELRRLAPDVAALQEVEPDQVEDLPGAGHHVVRHRSAGPAARSARVNPLPACGRPWIAARTGGTLGSMSALTLRLVARRHVDLHRVSSALCRA